MKFLKFLKKDGDEKMARKKKITGLPVLPTRLDLTDKRQGFLALLIGLLLVIIGNLVLPSFVSPGALVSTVMVLGLIVGLLNIFHKEALVFLILALSATFMLSVLATVNVFPQGVVHLFTGVASLFASASLVVALKVVYALTQ
ncbi:TPA: hypothetical protein HA231_03525 [Candidatus Woesearchaeota archaeon]|nr:hypothetical protein [Candidatus Woesearchaeota archaeon]